MEFDEEVTQEKDNEIQFLNKRHKLKCCFQSFLKLTFRKIFPPSSGFKLMNENLNSVCNDMI